MLRFAFVFGAFICSLALAQDKPVAGKVDFVEGDSMLEARDGGGRLPRVGDQVHEGDVVTTFPGAELHLRMADGASLALRENTKITITAYVANGDDADRSLIDLAKGSLRAVTGWIGKYRRAAYQVRTPLLTIGVRGTDHEPTHIPPGDPRGEPGSYDKVNEGRSFLQSKYGTVEVLPNRTAHFAPQQRVAPRILATPPAFFKPTRNEQRYVERARESVKTLDTQRASRREFVARQPSRPPEKSLQKPAAPAAKPAAQKPAVQKPVAQKPAAQKSVAQKPAIQKPAAQKPAAQKSAIQKPVAQKPAAQNPHPAAAQKSRPGRMEKKLDR